MTAANGIIITSSGNLTINNSTINFISTSSIIVQQGGKLALNNMILTTSNVNSPWQGIILNGISTIDQFLTASGKVQVPDLKTFNNNSAWEGQLNQSQTKCIMSNNTKIINVKKAVLVKDGAILRCKETEFKDFVTAVHILPYKALGHPLYNACYFMDCNFSWNAISTNSDFVTNKESLIGIKIESADGINIGGCNFTCNYSDNTRKIKERGWGIYAVNSNLNISKSGDRFCLDDYGCLNNCKITSKDNSFNNLSYGVWVDGFDPNDPSDLTKKTLALRNSSFNQIWKDINVINTTQSVVGYCISSADEGTLGEIFKDYWDKSGIDIYRNYSKLILCTNNSDNLSIYENDFTYSGRGCIYTKIVKTGNETSKFINNKLKETTGGASMDDLSWPLEMVYGLALVDNCEGLVVHCNEFIEMGADVNIEDNCTFWKTYTYNSQNRIGILGTSQIAPTETPNNVGNNIWSQTIQFRENILIDLSNNMPNTAKYFHKGVSTPDLPANNNSGLSLNIDRDNTNTILPDCKNPCAVFNILLSTKNSKENVQDFVVIPNPASEFIIIKNFNSKVFNLKIVDINGKVVLNKLQNSTKIDISNLTLGLYYLVIMDSQGKNYNTKFIKM